MSKNSISTLPRRRLGRTELMIPVVPFGTQGFGNHFGFVEDEKAVELIKHAISLGANHFDTARCYGDSQRKLGLAMKEVAREEVIITASKGNNQSIRVIISSTLYVILILRDVF